MKFKKPNFKIRIDLDSLWRITLLAFFVVFVVILALNTYVFFDLKKKIGTGAEEVEFSPRVLNKELLDSTVVDCETRKTVFDAMFSTKPDIEDPSGPIIMPEEEAVEAE